MAYLTVEEFTEVLAKTRAEELVQRYLFADESFAFRARPELNTVLVNHLCDRLPLKPEDVKIVGSGKMGFSLSPDKFPKAFTPESDIDVIMVNTELFDYIWGVLVSWHYPRYWSKLDGADNSFARSRKNDVFFGFMNLRSLQLENLTLTAPLRPLRDLRTKWFNAFQSLSSYTDYPEFATRKISGRLYRSWDYAIGYHAAGLRELSKKLDSRA